ncbi:MAG: zinc metallopeptidase [Halioglobus sp.]
MLYLILLLLLMLAIYGPQIWVRHAIRKHGKTIDALPGTGAELAQHLVERFELNGVNVERVSPNENYYSPVNKVIGLSPDVYDGKSLSAVAIAAHEVGHAIQYIRGEPVSRLRGRYAGRAHLVQNIGIFIIASVPLIGIVARSPALVFALVGVGIVAMLASVLFHALILPEEFDASFNKALPILAEGYITEAQLPAARQVLKAAALTYVAGALSDIFSIWRWIALLR